MGSPYSYSLQLISKSARKWPSCIFWKIMYFLCNPPSYFRISIHHIQCPEGPNIPIIQPLHSNRNFSQFFLNIGRNDWVPHIFKRVFSQKKSWEPDKKFSVKYLCVNLNPYSFRIFFAKGTIPKVSNQNSTYKVS